MSDIEEDIKSFDLKCMKFLAEYGKPISLGELKLLIFERERRKLPNRPYYMTYKKDVGKHKAGDGYVVKGKEKDDHFKVLKVIFPHFVESNLDNFLRLKVGVGYKRKKTKTGKSIQWTPETIRYWRKKEKQKELEASPEWQKKRRTVFTNSLIRIDKALIDRVKGLRALSLQREKAMHLWFNDRIKEYIQELENMLL